MEKYDILSEKMDNFVKSIFKSSKKDLLESWEDIYKFEFMSFRIEIREARQKNQINNIDYDYLVHQYANYLNILEMYYDIKIKG